MTEQQIMEAQPVEGGSRTLQLIEQAIAQGGSIDVAERLIALQERIMARAAEAEFADAMARMQPELPVIEEKGRAMNKSELRYTYAKWEDVNRAILPVLSKFGFSLNFDIKVEDGVVKVMGRLRHRGGHTQTSEFDMMPDDSGNKNKPQALGSATAYCKRYIAFGLLNLSSTFEEDDDGRQAGMEPITEKQRDKLIEGIKKAGADIQKFCARYEIEAVAELPMNKFELAMAELKIKKLTGSMPYANKAYREANGMGEQTKEKTNGTEGNGE